jgi:hypothetical protein
MKKTTTANEEGELKVVDVDAYLMQFLEIPLSLRTAN